MLDLILSRDFPRPDLGPNISRISASFQLKVSKNFSKWCIYIIPYFLVLHFGEHFMKIRTKIAKLQMHENLHKNVYENKHIYLIFFKKGN